MIRTRLPDPPNPATYVNVIDWQRHMFEWARKVKGLIETDSTVNTQPIGPFVVDAYTAVSTITGTDDTSNFVATLVTAMNQKGITAPNIQRDTT